LYLCQDDYKLSSVTVRDHRCNRKSDFQDVSEGHPSNVINTHLSLLSECFSPPITYGEGKRIPMSQSDSALSLSLGAALLRLLQKFVEAHEQQSLFFSSSLISIVEVYYGSSVLA